MKKSFYGAPKPLAMKSWNYELKNINLDKIKALKNKKEIISSKKEDLKSTEADWRPVHKKFGHRFTQMNTGSKIGRYSPKTLNHTGDGSGNSRIL